MKTIKHLLFRGGGLTLLGVFGVVLLGFVVVYLSLEFLPTRWLKVIGLSIGIGIAAIGGFSGRASALGLSAPFTNDPIGWRAAKKSYQDDKAPQAKEDDPKD